MVYALGEAAHGQYREERREEKTAAPARLVLLGASNIALGLPVVMEKALRLCGGPLEVLGAFGHGRSYGQRRSLLCRELPGITECGLWPALEQRPAAATAALVTDIGNDLLYETSVRDILAWVETCLQRLERIGARIVMTPLPLCTLADLGKAKFLFLRTILYPRCRLGLTTLVDRACELDEQLRAMCCEREITMVEVRRHWYGFDRIHIRRRYWAEAWHEFLTSLTSVPVATALAPTLVGRWPGVRLRVLAAERSWILRRERLGPQPAATWTDGTALSLY
jgi:hypothetical protein